MSTVYIVHIVHRPTAELPDAVSSVAYHESLPRAAATVDMLWGMRATNSIASISLVGIDPKRDHV